MPSRRGSALPDLPKKRLRWPASSKDGAECAPREFRVLMLRLSLGSCSSSSERLKRVCFATWDCRPLDAWT
eukprot:1059598-Alexandrium_andersonii.AAC.1